MRSSGEYVYARPSFSRGRRISVSVDRSFTCECSTRSRPALNAFPLSDGEWASFATRLDTKERTLHESSVFPWVGLALVALVAVFVRAWLVVLARSTLPRGPRKLTRSFVNHLHVLGVLA